MLPRCDGSRRISGREPAVSLDFSEVIEKLRYGPYGDERSEISQVLEDIDKDIQDYQSEMLDLQTRLTSLTCQYNRQISMRELYIGFISPIRLLPNEILTHIFEYCCETNRLGHASYHNPNCPALRISKVCFRWRRLAIAFPRLWSNMHMKLEQPPTERLKKETDLVSLFRLFLQRSQEHPLDLHIEDYHWYDSDDSHGYEEHQVMVLAVLNAQRWRRVFIAFPHGSPFQSRAFESLGSLPLLESVTVRQSLYTSWVAHMGPLNYAPKLTELALDGFLLDTRAHHFAWRQLTSLSLRAYAPSLFTILKLCTSLTNLHLDLNMETGHEQISCPATPSSPVELPQLRSMYLTSAGSPSSDSVLSSITVPFLTELHIRHSGPRYPRDGDDWLRNEIHALLTRSECSPSKFTLYQSTLSKSDISMATFLRDLPSLRELVIVETYLGSRAVSNLVLSSLDASAGSLSARQPLLPNLARFILVVCRDKDSDQPVIDDVLMVKAISSRWVPERSEAAEAGIACLKEFGLYFVLKAEFDWEPYKRLRELESAGLKLALGNGKHSEPPKLDVDPFGSM